MALSQRAYAVRPFSFIPSAVPESSAVTNTEPYFAFQRAGFTRFFVVVPTELPIRAIPRGEATRTGLEVLGSQSMLRLDRTAWELSFHSTLVQALASPAKTTAVVVAMINDAPLIRRR
ncbi:unannotated protein [freshwater metagenome]|uniref:Unannotated protein n=1 Tax=freshwater metagenome TaxID=449393 RepID=A0A6J7SA63_9ZZZZ